MTHIMIHGFHAYDSFEHMTGLIGIDRLTVYCTGTYMSHQMEDKV